jgi:hypothetical protein
MNRWIRNQILFLAAIWLVFLPATLSSEIHAARAPGTCNTPENRACWTEGFDVETDYEASTPDGVTREFDWEISEVDNWVGPDGVVKEKVMLINNDFPGPVIYADWGDTIVVNVRNNLRTNGYAFSVNTLMPY